MEENKGFKFDDDELADMDFGEFDDIEINSEDNDNDEADIEQETDDTVGYKEYTQSETAESSSGKTESEADIDNEDSNSEVTNGNIEDTYADNNSFISESGEIEVMEQDEKEDNFKLEYIDIDKIAIMPRIRKNKSIESLMLSIKNTGLLQPIMVAPTQTEGVYVLLAGYRRIIACAKLGMKRIPCTINSKVKTTEIPVVEALYNHSKSYGIKEMVDYIDYLEKQKGMMSPNMIEYLLQMNTGDYTKLKDIMNDNDPDIVDKLFNGTYTIESAFKALEKKRKKQSAEEKEMEKADKAYDESEHDEVDSITGAGEEVEGDVELSDDEIKSLAIGAQDLDDGLEDQSLEEMVEEGKNIQGFEDKVQDSSDREYTDPTVRKSVLVRDKYTCQCCMEGGESYIDVLEAHHILPVFLNKSGTAISKDNIDNLITVCMKCHRQIHLFSTNELVIPKEKNTTELDAMEEKERILYENERMKFKRIVKLGTVIRKGMEAKGIKLAQYRKDHPSKQVGHTMPSYRNSNVTIDEVREATKTTD